MARIPDDKRRAVEPYLKFVRMLEDDIDLGTRVAHILTEFERADFEALAETLDERDVRAGFPVPAVHLDTRTSLPPVIEQLADDGHEILLHGYRHTSFMETPYETAHEELSRAMEILEAATGTTPTGFHVPYGRASPGTLSAAADLDIEWVVGSRVSEGADDDLTVVQPVRPYDIQLLEGDDDPAAAFERLGEKADGSSLLLVHPNVHPPHDAADAFAEWLGGYAVSSPGESIAGTGDGPGLLLDCFPPFQVG